MSGNLVTAQAAEVFPTENTRYLKLTFPNVLHDPDARGRYIGSCLGMANCGTCISEIIKLKKRIEKDDEAKDKGYFGWTCYFSREKDAGYTLEQYTRELRESGLEQKSCHGTRVTTMNLWKAITAQKEILDKRGITA